MMEKNLPNNNYKERQLKIQLRGKVMENVSNSYKNKKYLDINLSKNKESY